MKQLMLIIMAMLSLSCSANKEASCRIRQQKEVDINQLFSLSGFWEKEGDIGVSYVIIKVKKWTVLRTISIKMRVITDSSKGNPDNIWSPDVDLTDININNGRVNYLQRNNLSYGIELKSNCEIKITSKFNLKKTDSLNDLIFDDDKTEVNYFIEAIVSGMLLIDVDDDLLRQESFRIGVKLSGP